MNNIQSNCKVLRLDEVRAVTGLSRSAIYDKGCRNSKYFDPTFPARFKIGQRSVAWDSSEIAAWIKNRKGERLQTKH